MKFEDEKIEIPVFTGDEWTQMGDTPHGRAAQKRVKQMYRYFTNYNYNLNKFKEEWESLGVEEDI